MAAPRAAAPAPGQCTGGGCAAAAPEGTAGSWGRAGAPLGAVPVGFFHKQVRLAHVAAYAHLAAPGTQDSKCCRMGLGQGGAPSAGMGGRAALARGT